MKNKLINFASFFVFAITSLLVTSCDNDDLVPEFTLQPSSEEVTLLNSLSEQYLLSKETKDNIAERFVWNAPNFGVQTEINYEVEASVSETFNSVDFHSGELVATNYAIKVSDLLTMAQDALLLDTDPSTIGDDGEPNNNGTIYFRINAYVGSGAGADAINKTSEIFNLNISLIEDSLTGEGSGIEVSTWGIVGSGYNNWGAYADAPFYTTSDSDVLVAYATLFDGEIKFRENNEWTNDYGDTGVDGVLDAGGDNIAVTAGNYKVTFNTSTLAYSIEPFSWGIVGSGYNDWGATPDAKFYYDYTTDTFKVGVKLIDGEIKFRFNNAWDTDFGDSGADGTLDAGGDNIVSTNGFYTVTLDFNNNEYTIVESDIWGVIGSGYNDWGATPDFSLTEVNPGLWVGDIINLIDGEIKFRLNEAWDSDFGDTGADGTLDAGGDNIVSTGGSARIVLDINNGTYSINQ
ncbi:SusE domain-containing protein [Lutibacter citreus]|uniref:SusE domain-containing protein n=1 Tax=Lutibacter citreus TaxID=2138210 RepID=UPI000DBE372F|nr:SusE domain-containing protein [Lutibacter citreus]